MMSITRLRTSFACFPLVDVRRCSKQWFLFSARRVYIHRRCHLPVNAGKCKPPFHGKLFYLHFTGEPLWFTGEFPNKPPRLGLFRIGQRLLLLNLEQRAGEINLGEPPQLAATKLMPPRKSTRLRKSGPRFGLLFFTGELWGSVPRTCLKRGATRSRDLRRSSNSLAHDKNYLRSAGYQTLHSFPAGHQTSGYAFAFMKIHLRNDVSRIQSSRSPVESKDDLFRGIPND